MNRADDFLRILRETTAGRTVQMEIEAENRRYIRRFVPKERMILLGGGHIAASLCEFASALEFDVVVVDDRPSFANHERFPRAAAVVCDGFAQAIENLQITASDYVCVLTRGHRWDGECLRKILAGDDPAYLGMVGSRRRVRGLLGLLKEEGFDEEKLSRIHSPIGLSIHAQTPAEIAVSICAEVIQERRSRISEENQDILHRTDTDAALLRFLAENPVPMAYMIVISTEGSTPVQSGAFMAVDRTGQMRGTIGGGCGEAKALNAARALIGTGDSRLIRVDMTNDVAMEEGMVCGGRMTVFIQGMPVTRTVRSECADSLSGSV